MKLSNKTLGIIAMIGAPFLFMEMCSDSKFGLANTAAAGICDFIYMTGWICSIIGLINLEAAGSNKWSKNLLRLNLVFLGIVIAVRGKLTGFSRYTPVIAGFWVGFAMLFGTLSGWQK